MAEVRRSSAQRDASGYGDQQPIAPRRRGWDRADLHLEHSCAHSNQFDSRVARRRSACPPISSCVSCCIVALSDLSESQLGLPLVVTHGSPG
jgi:hypothetical protein